MDKVLKKNLLYAIIAQTSSLLLSILMSLIVPKFLNVKSYGYWQLFLFYVSYAGFFHFGISDGIYLKLGGKKFKNLDKEDLNNQFHILLYIQLVICAMILIYSCIFIHSTDKFYIMFISAFYILIANLNWFLGFVFQATNLTKIYSTSVIIDRILFILILICIFLIGVRNYLALVIFFTITRIIALIYCMIKSKSILKVKTSNLKKSLKNTIDYIKIGINLTLASIASMLIVGIGRFLVEHKWGISEFGKFSFSVSLTNFFLTFIQQVSMILFPALRQLDDEKKIKNIYASSRKYLNIILPLIFVCYIPCKIILSIWLPQYKVSLSYLALLLPLCIFDGKMQMLSNTYMKVLRKEKKLLLINFLTFVFSMVFSALGTYIIENIYFVIIGLVLAIVLRSTISELYLMKEMKIDSKEESKNIIMEILISILFMMVNLLSNDYLAFFIIIIVYLIYCIILKDNFKYVFTNILNKIKHILYKQAWR